MPKVAGKGICAKFTLKILLHPANCMVHVTNLFAYFPKPGSQICFSAYLHDFVQKFIHWRKQSRSMLLLSCIKKIPKNIKISQTC